MRTPKPTGKSSSGYSRTHHRCWLHKEEIANHINATVIAFSEIKRGKRGARLPNWTFYCHVVH
jgi:hypothetical protein